MSDSGCAIAYEQARRSWVARVAGSLLISPRWSAAQAGRTCSASMKECITYVPLLDEDDPRDHRFLGDFIAAFGGMDFAAPPGILGARLARGSRAASHGTRGRSRASSGWARRFTARAGGLSAAVRDRPRALHLRMSIPLLRRISSPRARAGTVGRAGRDRPRR